MFEKKLCPQCKTGKRTYQLDSSSTECPYIYCHNGKSCAMYERLDEHKKQGIFEYIAGKVFPKNKN